MSEASFEEVLKALAVQGAKENLGSDHLRRLLESMSSIPDPATHEACEREDIEKMVRGYRVFLEMAFALRGVQVCKSGTLGLGHELEEVLEAMPAVRPGLSNVTSVDLNVSLIGRLLSNIEQETAILFHCLSHLHPYMVALAKYDEERKVAAVKARKKQERKNPVKAFIRLFKLL
ncbi:hypothetical protein BC567DRAFT_298965 [Phyllosticta citribraziliensis]